MKQTLGIIGGNGWLGSAVSRSILARGVIAPEQLVVTASRSGYRYAQWPGVTCVDDVEALLVLADVVMISVRPEQFDDLEIRDALQIKSEHKLVMSLMAGVSQARLVQATGSDRIVRAMPNAAAAIGASYTPWCATAAVSEVERQWIQTLLTACGTADELNDEGQLDTLTVLTGSGPAFPALLADALINHALEQGIPESVARRGVLSSLAGSLSLMLDGDDQLGDVVSRFLAYDGVTSRGLEAMIERGFEQTVRQGLDAAQARLSGTE
ncbi:pyrroline-5-carboxylate reductase family protein [Salinicola halimionae]|uniref:pyrroline-5-carboxylate reductase family protein n=1 Tax=Salinicola halimionae TaxID=1949081 RepID=UPI000DA18CEC|nr:pyrroline-5-carboxylate reductase dimerization domain-containing protein [Salinicola halimionae]